MNDRGRRQFWTVGAQEALRNQVTDSEIECDLFATAHAL